MMAPAALWVLVSFHPPQTILALLPTCAVSDADAEEAELESYVEALQARRREMDEELAAFKESRAEQSSLNEAGEPVASSGAERKITKAERAFDRVMRESSGLPGSGGSSRGSSRAPSSTGRARSGSSRRTATRASRPTSDTTRRQS